MNAVLLPVSNPLAGHMMEWSLKNTTTNSINAPVTRQARIWATESLKSSTVWPRTWRVSRTIATCMRGSRMLGGITVYSRPRIRIDFGLDRLAGPPAPSAGGTGAELSGALRHLAKRGRPANLVTVG